MSLRLETENQRTEAQEGNDARGDRAEAVKKPSILEIHGTLPEQSPKWDE